jgi:hypothetical protein
MNIPVDEQKSGNTPETNRMEERFLLMSKTLISVDNSTTKVRVVGKNELKLGNELKVVYGKHGNCVFLVKPAMIGDFIKYQGEIISRQEALHRMDAYSNANTHMINVL